MTSISNYYKKFSVTPYYCIHFKHTKSFTRITCRCASCIYCIFYKFPDIFRFCLRNKNQIMKSKVKLNNEKTVLFVLYWKKSHFLNTLNSKCKLISKKFWKILLNVWKYCRIEFLFKTEAWNNNILRGERRKIIQTKY